MTIKKHCPNCGSLLEDDIDFCTQCGYNLRSNRVVNVEKNGFFDNITEKTSFAVIVFAFAVFGIFLFVGSVFWMSFLSSSRIGLTTYLLLTIVFAVFFGGMFIGYVGCKDKSYINPNFHLYLGSIVAVLLCGFGLIFSILMGVIGMLGSAFNSLGSGSSTTGSYSTAASPYFSDSGNVATSGDFGWIIDIIFFIVLIPVAAYVGVYLGHLIKESL